MARRSAKGGGTIRQRSDGRWEARFHYVDDLGQTQRRSVYGLTQKECRKKLTAALKEVDDGTFKKPDGKKWTVEGWMKEWLKVYVKPTLKPLTYSAYETSIRVHILPHIGKADLQAVRGIHIQKIYNSMIEAGSSPKTVKNAAAILHKALETAVKQGYLSKNPCDAATIPKISKKEIVPLSDAEIPLFLAKIEDSPFRNAYAVALFSGMREGELLGLSWDQVDFEKGHITVCQQLQHSREKGGGYYISQSTKTGSNRTIEPPKICFDYLINERQRQRLNQIAAGDLWYNPYNLVFTNEIGEFIKAPTYFKRFKKIAASIGRPDARPHDLRHTAATVALSAGADIKSVQSLLGHSTPSFTLSVYAHTTEKMMQDTSARVQNYYDNLSKKA